MIKRIIIEGADQQGKTTLREILAEKLGWNVVHFGKPHEGFDYINDYRLPVHTISDRNFLSEVVYSRINNRKSKAAATLLCNIHRNDDTLLILMDRERHFVFDASREEAYDEAQIKLAVYYYRQEFDKLNIKKLKLNPNCLAFKSHVESIITMVNESI